MPMARCTLPTQIWNDLQAFLSKWRDERDMAHSILKEHSQWLQSFREEMKKAAKHAMTRAPAAGSSGRMTANHKYATRQHRQMNAGGSEPEQPHAAWVTSQHTAVRSNNAAEAAPSPHGLLPRHPDMAAARLQSGGTGVVLGAGYPMRLDIGGNQELIISVQHR
eukprot:jgi/Chrzof1/11389/Cz05g34290.t1